MRPSLLHGQSQPDVCLELSTIKTVVCSSLDSIDLLFGKNVNILKVDLPTFKLQVSCSTLLDIVKTRTQLCGKAKKAGL